MPKRCSLNLATRASTMKRLPPTSSAKAPNLLQNPGVTSWPALLQKAPCWRRPSRHEQRDSDHQFDRAGATADGAPGVEGSCRALPNGPWPASAAALRRRSRSEEHTSEL